MVTIISIVDPKSGQEILERSRSQKDGRGVFWKPTAGDRWNVRISEKSEGFQKFTNLQGN